MKAFLLSLCVLFFCQQVIAQERAQQAVTVLTQFKTAVIKRDTAAALKYVDERTLDWVSDMAKMATTFKKEDLNVFPVFIQYMLLSVRHFTQGKDLGTISNKELFSILIREGVLANYINRMQAGTPQASQPEGAIRIPFLLDERYEGMYPWELAPGNAVLVDFHTILSNTDQLISVDFEVSGKTSEAYLEFLFKKNFNQSIRPTDWEPVK